MSIQTGQTAPSFTLPEKPGAPVDVGAAIGSQPVVLLFFPLAFSPVCTDEMCHFRDGWSEWSRLDAAVFGISVDSPFVTDRFRAEQSIPFPILSDFNKEVSRLYGVLHEDLMGLKGVSKRSAFVVDRGGTVVFAWVSEDPRVQVPFDEIKAAVVAAAGNTAVH